MIELFVTCGVRTDVCEMLQPEQGRVFAHCFLLVSVLHEREPQRPCQEAKSAPQIVYLEFDVFDFFTKLTFNPH